MNKKVADGWHKVYNYDVMIEDGIVSHATDEDHTRTLYPYRSTLWGGMNRIYKEEKLTLNALRSGLRRGTIALR